MNSPTPINPHTVISYIRGWFALVFLAFGGLAASALVVPFVIFGGRRNKVQHWVERCWAGGVLWIAGIKVEIRGAEHLPKGGCVLTPNHRSNADILAIMGYAATPARFIAKAKLKWVFFISLGMWATGHIFVKRGRWKSSGKALGTAARECRKGAWLLLFPEGTRVEGDASIPWKTGAFRVAIDAQVPVVPVVIRHARRLWPTEELVPRSGTITVEFLEPVETTGMEPKAYGPLRNRVRDAVIEELGA